MSPSRTRPRSEPQRCAPARRSEIPLALGLAGVLVGLFGYAALFPPDPVSGDLELVRSARPGLRVLFVGNRLTADNSMPSMVRGLGEGDAGAPPLFVVQYARRASTLEDALPRTPG